MSANLIKIPGLHNLSLLNQFLCQAVEQSVDKRTALGSAVILGNLDLFIYRDP